MICILQLRVFLGGGGGGARWVEVQGGWGAGTRSLTEGKVKYGACLHIKTIYIFIISVVILLKNRNHRKSIYPGFCISNFPPNLSLSI